MKGQYNAVGAPILFFVFIAIIVGIPILVLPFIGLIFAIAKLLLNKDGNKSSDTHGKLKINWRYFAICCALAVISGLIFVWLSRSQVLYLGLAFNIETAFRVLVPFTIGELFSLPIILLFISIVGFYESIKNKTTRLRWVFATSAVIWLVLCLLVLTAPGSGGIIGGVAVKDVFVLNLIAGGFLIVVVAVVSKLLSRQHKK